MNSTKTIVQESLTRALEIMAFMAVSEDVSELSLPDELIVSRIDFKGSQSGSLELGSDIAFAIMFAQNMSGIEDVEPEQYLGAMDELVNVACGLVLPLLADSPSDIFDVTVPVQKTISQQEFSLDGDFEVLNVEGFALAVRLNIDQ